MLDDGLNVILSDELKAKLYMTKDDTANLLNEPHDENDDVDPGKDLLARKA